MRPVLRALLIDDEPLAHQVLRHHLSQHPDIEVLKSCFNAAEALAFLADNEVDLLFLDIQMPVLSGIALLKVLANRPQVVIVSAYSDYALEGFALDVTDYLQKPVGAVRFAEALEKVRRRALASLAVQPDAPVAEHVMGKAAAIASPAGGREDGNASLLVRVDREDRKLVLADIHYLEAYGNFVKIWLGDHCLLTASTLKQLLGRLPNGHFVQIHKSFAVNVAQIAGRGSQQLTLKSGVKLRIGQAYKAGLSQVW
ncbi:LytTR family DNA-binding domain-containing protein [Shewanella sp. 3B26]|uniref:LytTR family DNA-binding domain-containing protein n=1 Tax=Shewanella zhuhaiensis TaxID=2919576 RepID=A0AAJ1BK27_9GAMM|nr:LytTR family DNA-binding domain-containing protein [Shewanella zhuhaiensis]MCH4296320.1 LytTR family DNA-binding domain-containing protein [Shewanella zhuhaiensis]